jgi:hypothetical protein
VATNLSLSRNWLTGFLQFEKFEDNIAIALFLAKYDFELCDQEGEVLTEAPKFNVNNQNSSRADNPAYLRIWPR